MTYSGQATTGLPTKEYRVPAMPLEVRVAWTLSCVRQEYRRSGRWVMPTDSNGNSKNDSANLGLGLLTTSELLAATPEFTHLTSANVVYPPASSSPSELLSSQVQAQGEAFPAESLRKLTQRNLPGTPEPIETGPAKSKATGYPYRASIYWDYACRLLVAYQERAGERIERDMDGCKLVLTAVAAWLRFPLFGGGAGREWMTLGLERLRQETSMKNERLMDCLTQLQEIRLLQTFRAIIPFGGNYPGGSQGYGYGKGQGLIGRSTPDKEDTGKILVSLEEFMELKAACADLAAEYGGGKEGYWQPRAIQKTNNFYRFKPMALLPEEKVELDVLPVFNPFDLAQLANSASKGKKSATTQEQAQMQVKAQPGSTLKAQETETREVPLHPAAVEANPASTQARSNAGSSWEVRGEYVRHIPKAAGSTSSEVGTYFPASQKAKEALPVKETAGERLPNVLPKPACSLKHVHVVVDGVGEGKETALAFSNFQATPETERNSNQGSNGYIPISPGTLGETSLAEAYLQLTEASQAEHNPPFANNDPGVASEPYEPATATPNPKTTKHPTLYEARLARLSAEKLTLHNSLLHLVELLGCEEMPLVNMSPIRALELAELYELPQFLQLVEWTKGKLARGEVHTSPIGLVVTGLERGFVLGDISREEQQLALAADQLKRRREYLSGGGSGGGSGSNPGKDKARSRVGSRKDFQQRDYQYHSDGRASSPTPRASETASTSTQAHISTSAGLELELEQELPQAPVQSGDVFTTTVAATEWASVLDKLYRCASYSGFSSATDVEELLAHSRLEVLPPASGGAGASSSPAPAQTRVQVQVQVVLGASWQLASLPEPARQAITLELRRLAPGCQVSFTSLP